MVTKQTQDTTTAAEAAEQATREAREDLVRQRGELSAWLAKLAGGERRLVELEGVSGEDLLADPGMVDRVAAETVHVRSSLDQYRRAVEALRERVTTAERAFLAVEAVRLHEVEVAPREAALAAHRVKVEALLAQLVDLEGCRFVPEPAGYSHDGGTLESTSPPGVALGATMASDLVPVRRQVHLLRVMADGQDPTGLVDEATFQRGSAPRAEFYPAAVWGPDAVVPAPEYATKVAQAEQRVLDAETARAVLLDEVDALEGVYQLPMQMGRLLFGTQLQVDTGITTRLHQVENLDTALTGARAEVAALTGAPLQPDEPDIASDPAAA